MARPPRIDFPDALYHVTTRGNGRARLFFTDQDRTHFLEQLRDGVVTAGVVLYGFVLMDNHFHLLVRTPRANLSGFMQRLKTSYALYARYKHRRPGHLFEGRFKAKLVQDETYLLALTRFIHLNPVKTAVCRSLSRAERVRRLEGYDWSSYPGYVSAKRAIDWVCYDVLKEYSFQWATARRQYRAYTHACLLEDDRPIREALQASRYAIGDESFRETTERQLARRRRGRAQDADVALPRLVYTLERIDAVVSAEYGVRAEALKSLGHTAGVRAVSTGSNSEMTDQDFLSLLNSIDFPRRYWELCDRFPIRAIRPQKSGWKEAILAAFGEMAIVPEYYPEDRLFTCEDEQIGDFVWHGALCKTRQSGIELMFGGQSRDRHLGSNLAVLAYDAKRLADPTFERNPFSGPPPYPRPADNNDPVELKEVVKEFVVLVRLIKDAIRREQSNPR